MRIIIDRFEGSFAIVELPNKTMVNVPRAVMPQEAREGAIIRIEVDKAETDKSKERISNLMEDLFQD